MAARHQIRENLMLAFDTLRSHKFRSFLTVLGVVIGTTTVIAVTSLVTGLDNQLVEVAEQFGTRTLWVYKLEMGAPHAMTNEEKLRKPLSYDDAVAIRDQVPDAARVSVELFAQMGDMGLPPVSARYKSLNMDDALFVGVTAEHLFLLNATVHEGRFFTEPEDQHRRDIAVIGDGVDVYKRQTYQSIWVARPELMVYVKAPDAQHMRELEDEVRALMRRCV